MSRRTGFAFTLLLLSNRCWAAESDPCSAAPSTSDIRFTLALKGGRALFQEGEIIPLVLSFASTAKNRYVANPPNYDYGRRAGLEDYCLDIQAPDPLESYYRFGGLDLGGLSFISVLDAASYTTEAELNEWRTLSPGHYRLYAMSRRVWRPPDVGEQISEHEVLRSNVLEFDVKPADPAWQDEQLRSAIKTLAGAPSAEEARRAVRKLRFLNTPDSTRQLAKLFWGINEQQPAGWDLMFGLYVSSYRKLAIDSMREQFAVPGHPITSEFMSVLVSLQLSSDSAWNSPPADIAHSAAAGEFWKRREAYKQALAQSEIERVVAALPRKTGRARALTLNALLMTGQNDPALARTIRPALIAAWNDLPRETRRDLIQYRWPLIAGPEMLPILRRVMEDQPPSARTESAFTRDAALKHIYELDPVAGRALVLRDLLDRSAEPGMDVVKLLPKEDIALAIQPAVERIGEKKAREVDYELLDRYADPAALGFVQPVFEERLGEWTCEQQSAMLRYFLRVDPAYGGRQVSASLQARTYTHCNLLQSLRDEASKVQQSAIEALDDSDSELAQDAATALGHWGSADAEAALWTRLRRFHEEWAGRESELRSPPVESPESRAVMLEQALVNAIATGSSWICPPGKLARLAELVSTRSQRQQIEDWTKPWKQESLGIHPTWSEDLTPAFSILQYSSLTEDQLRTKLAQLPRGTQLRWQFWPPGQIFPPVSMEVQDAAFERMREVAAKNGATLVKINHP